MAATLLDVRPAQAPSFSNPRIKPPPKAAEIPVPFAYFPSSDGIDENIVILLHGLGDTHVPFAKLGKQLNLPQTAILALRAPERIPFLFDEEAYQWYPSFDDLGEPLAHPNPAPALALLDKVLAHLAACCWRPQSIHLFGFAQGGSVAVESALAWWKAQRQKQKQKNAGPGVTGKSTAAAAPNDSDNGETTHTPLALGSVVSIAGAPLMQHALSSASKCPTPLFLFHRTASPSSTSSDAKRYFSAVREVMFVDSKANESMPRSRDEWAPIMEFWSQRLARRAPQSDGVEGLYEVLSGGIPS